ncbi:MAG: hypothetical protein QNJ18_08515 [Xenococcaceae cyanobacterium MO_167.B52]|nr:hypothetical protein [Xenococcaceae cyanobacterium MO_167.B52]
MANRTRSLSEGVPFRESFKANAMITSKASNFPWRNSWRVSDKETLDYIGDFGSHSGFCDLGRAFSSDYMPLSLYNSAFLPFLGVSS